MQAANKTLTGLFLFFPYNETAALLFQFHNTQYFS